MAFPETPLPIKVELKVGSTWTDVTSDVRAADQIRIARGRSDEGSQVDTTRCSFTLDNNSGKYSPRNPTGAYYGSIGRNTPCRISVTTGDPYLDLPGGSDYAETPDTAVLDITGDLDVRLDASFANWLPPNGTGVNGTIEMIGKFGTTGQKSWFLGARNGVLYFEWSPDGTNTLSASSTVAPVIPGAGGRLAVRATLDVNNGSGGNTVRFYTAETLDSPWTQLGDAVTQTGTTSIFNSTAGLRVGNATSFLFVPPTGHVHQAEVRSGLSGTVVANPDFTAQPVGTTSFTDGAGRTWTLNGNAAITNRRNRFVGEISAWPVRWETKHDVVVQVEASGVLRRLSQGASPVRSAIYREFTNPSRSGIVAYWPMEDGAGATSLASAFDGHPAVIISASGVTPANYTGWAASDAIPTLETGGGRARVPSYTATNATFIRFFAEVPTGGVASTQRLFSFVTTGTARTWSLYVNTAGDLDLRAHDVDGTQIMATGFDPVAINGRPVHIGVELTQDGADIDYTLIVFYVDESTLTTASQGGAVGTLAGYTAGSALEVRFGQDGGMNGTALGHIAVANSSTAYANTLKAMVAWEQEEATARIFRLGEEEDIPAFPVIGGDQEMGIQRLATLLDLVREAEAADGGILCEARDFLGMRYRDRLSLYNQPAAMVLDYEGDDGLVTPLEPVDDDQRVRNDITVSRTGGSSARVTLDEGTLSTQAPPDGVGRYDESVTLNLYADEQLDDVAGWRLHLGTWDATRYPLVKMMLANATHMIETAAAIDIGDRIHIENPPSWLPPDTIDLRIEGYTETLDQHTWTQEYNCSPAGAWDVAWAGDDDTASAEREFAWVDTDGSELAEDLTTTETDVDIFVTDGELWTSELADSPYDITVGGEVMTVTAPGALLNGNPFFTTATTGWTGQGSTIARSTDIVHPHPSAVASLKVTPTASGNANALNSSGSGVAVAAGNTYNSGVWVYVPAGFSDVRVRVNWHDSGGAYLSTSSSTAFNIPAATWTYIEQENVAPASAATGYIVVGLVGTPAVTDIAYYWAARLTATSASALHDTFSRTVASSWGTADSGTAWNTVGGGTAADYSVGSGYAVQVLATVDVSRRTSIAAPHADFDIYCDLTTSATATGDSLYGGITARMVDANNMYTARVEFTTGNAIILSVRKLVGGVQTQLGTYTMAGVTHVAGTFVRVRFQGIGTAFKAKIWRVTDPEPDTWRITATDTAFSAAQQIGTRSIRVTGNTNAATVQIRYDNYRIVNPQRFTVTRSANGVAKSHSAGADIRLADPAYIAL
ncbi:hypothetical protein H1V43_32095 [Streptomyces sp. PSKA54]|uniref:Uncharacterized protein n=1 Tax=Streptomyces himalayensis subsp. aureolus TaxID=2758039 RepID=A0A7W2HJA4_9ACTN|nr:hypothetical protein [Streptomyces himalayensis]MBA4865906.1 hypothetical protein [Streptomyces himalayensis subsp. aureolus]